MTVVEMEMVVGGSWGAGAGVPAAGAGAAVVAAAAGGAAGAEVGAGEPAGAGVLAAGGAGPGVCAAGVGTRVTVDGTAVTMAGWAGTCCAQIPA